MDELFRLTPAERRKRRILQISALGLIVLVTLIVLGVRYAKSEIKKSNTPVPPSAYLVTLNGDTQVKISGKNTHVENTLTLPAGATLEIPANTRIGIIYPNTGKFETLTTPAANALTLTPATPPQPDADSLDFFISPREHLSAAHYNGPGESTGRVYVTSPFGVTRFTNPIITWEPRPGTRYDVAVIDPSDPDAPARIALNMLPPVRVDQLETTETRELVADRLYNVIVREAGSETQVGGMRFLVSPDATNATLPKAPAELLQEALQALTSKPARTGDAWLALSRLPPDWAESEFVLRLRMRAASELGLFGEIQNIQYQLGTLGFKK